MEITERQAEILERIVREYIRSARPVSSKSLEKKCQLRICAPTIRLEMQKLTDRGYLYQPHTSAGRIPTDRAYRFLVNNFLEKKVFKLKDNRMVKEEMEEIIRREKEDILRLSFQLTRFLAHSSSTIAIFRLLDKNLSLKDGWEELIKSSEFEDKNFLFLLGEFLKDFEKDIEKLKIESEIEVFIGEENKSLTGKGLSVIISKCRFPHDEEGLISLVGPKRMAYEHNISLLNSLREILEKM